MQSDTRFSSAVPFQPAWKEPSRPTSDHYRLTCKSCRPVKSFLIPAAKPDRSDRTIFGPGPLVNGATPFQETRPNVHRSFLAQMNARPRKSATDTLCLDPTQAAGLVIRSVFQPEFLPHRRFELLPTSPSI